MEKKPSKSDLTFNNLIAKRDAIRLSTLPKETVQISFTVTKPRNRKLTAKQREYERILKRVRHIMIRHGPDGHTDGSEIIARYIQSLLRKKK